MLGGFVRHLGHAPCCTARRFVCPVGVLPGCSTPRAMLQHWAPTMCGGRESGILAKVELALQLMELIAPERRFANVAWRSLGLLTLRRDALLSLPLAVELAEPLQRVDMGSTIWLASDRALPEFRVDLCRPAAPPHVLRALALRRSGCFGAGDWVAPAADPLGHAARRRSRGPSPQQLPSRSQPSRALSSFQWARPRRSSGPRWARNGGRRNSGHGSREVEPTAALLSRFGTGAQGQLVGGCARHASPPAAARRPG